MAQPRRTKATQEPATRDVATSSELAAHLGRIAKTLALLAVKSEPQEEQIASLTGLGYSPSEIAELLGTTSNTVSVTLYQRRARRRPRKNKQG